MSRPRISIAIPTYNRAGMLRECIHHALKAPSDAEIVVVDNASTDATPALMEELRQRDGRLRYVRNQTNIGMVANLNRAMRESRGDYLCVVCDDDLILPGHCEKKADILDRFPEIAFVYGPWHMIDAAGNSQGVPLGSGQLTYPYIGGRDEFGDLLQNNHIMMNGALFRRSLLEELGGLDESPDFAPSHDWEMWLRYSFGRQTAYLPEPTVCVRFHDASESAVSGTGHGAFAKARVNIWKRWLVERDPPIVLNENIWARMRALWEQDLNYWFRQDQSQVVPYLEALEGIRQENRRLNERRVAVAVSDQSSDDGHPLRVIRDQSEAGGMDPARSATVNPPHPTCIRITANFFDYSGYARLSRDAALALDAAGAPLAIEPEGGSQRFVADEVATASDLFSTWQRLKSAEVAEEVSIYIGVPTWWDGTDAFARHRETMSGRRTEAGSGQPAFAGIAMFETDRIPEGWAAACNGMDEIWVPSEFNRETFARSGVDAAKLRVIPFGLDAAAYEPENVEPLSLSGRAGFNFLSVFQWSRRKGWDVLLSAYFRAFSSEDDVCLVIRAYPDGPGAEPVKTCIERHITEDPTLNARRSALPRVEILEDFIAERDMPRLYRAADCFVLPSRGEGWGIPFMEAMASALPVIATAWSAHLDFMSEETAYLIPMDGVVPVDREQTARNPFYGADHCWAEPSVDETARLMRRVFDNRAEAAAKGRRARAHIAENWTLERTAAWILERAAERTAHGERTPGSPTQRPNDPTARYRNPQSVIRSPISWSAPLFDPSGYAEEARHFLLALDEAGVAVSAQDVRWSSRNAVLSADHERRLTAMMYRPCASGGAHVSHILPTAFTKRPDAQVNIGRTMFETDRLPEGWAAACNRMDRIWVPSEFNRETFALAGVDPNRISVVPGAIDPAPYDPLLPPLQIDGARGYNFLSVFDWSLRKGWDVLVRAFVEEFAQIDDVALVIKTHSSLGYTTEQIVEQVARFVRDELGRDPEAIPDIIFQDGDLPAHLMPRLYLAADCFVLPTRGEGWGRPFMEAMTLGMPVIGTNWSGSTAFMNQDNSYLLDFQVVPVPELAWRETPTFCGHRWAEPDSAHLRRLMRQVFEDRTAAQKTGAVGRDHILTHYSYYQVSTIIQEEIERALQGGPVRTAFAA